MTDHTKPRSRGRPVGTLQALSGRRWLALVSELRDAAGPVNLAATAKEYGISRGTLLKYIKEEPGLLEAIQARREANGRGYVPIKRGSRATRAAAKVKREAQRALPPAPQPDGVPPPEVMAALNRHIEELDSWPRFQAELEGEGRTYIPPGVEKRPALSPLIGEKKFDGRRLLDMLPPVVSKKDKKTGGL